MKIPGLRTLIAAAAALAALTATPLAADSMVADQSFLPIVHIVGATGIYVSDVSLFNPQSYPVGVSLYFTPADTDGTNAPEYRLNPDLQPRETVTLQDILYNTFGVSSGYGLLEVKTVGSPGPDIIVTSNTINIADNCTGGTFGQFSPGQPERNSVGFGNTNDYDLYVAGIPNDPYHRTNAVIMNPSKYTLYATMQLVDSAANTWGYVTATVPPYSMHQFNDVFGNVFGSLSPSVDDAWRLNFYVNTNTGATLLAYVTISDTRSGDPYLVPASAQVVNVPLARPSPLGATRAPAALAKPQVPTRGTPVVTKGTATR